MKIDKDDKKLNIFEKISNSNLKGVILNNKKFVGINILTIMTRIKNYNCCAKIYNKIAYQFTSPGVRKFLEIILLII